MLAVEGRDGVGGVGAEHHHLHEALLCDEHGHVEALEVLKSSRLVPLAVGHVGRLQIAVARSIDVERINNINSSISCIDTAVIGISIRGSGVFFVFVGVIILARHGSVVDEA